MSDFYERHPYPEPADDLAAYRNSWNDGRRRAESHLFWPAEPYREDRSILVAGCGTMQAAHYAVRWPSARVVGIDVSAKSIAFGEGLKRKHALKNLELRRLAIEEAAVLGRTFDYVVCTGVLHHLTDPDAGLRALRDVLSPRGALHVMVYAPYGRAGIYMLQEYCRRLGIGSTEAEIDELAATLRGLPLDHPLAPLIQKSPDFTSTAGLADALLHPNDRAYTVSDVMTMLERSDLAFGRWLRQAPYLPWCGSPARTPHHARLTRLRAEEQYAALELFRGTMVRHNFIAYGRQAAVQNAVDFESDACLHSIPIRVPDTIVVRDGLPAGATAVLINPSHTYTDLYLPIDGPQETLFSAIDGQRTIADICGDSTDRSAARDFFRQLWRWDQIVVRSG